MEEDLIQQSLDDYDAGKYSPRLLTAHELPLDAHVLEPDEDLQRLQLSRQQLQVTGARWGCGKRWGFPYLIEGLNLYIKAHFHLLKFNLCENLFG